MSESSVLPDDIEADLRKLVHRAYEAGRQSVLEPMREAMSQVASGESSSAPSKTATKKSSRKKRKNWWDTATPEQKKDRVRKMLAARGLKPKQKRYLNEDEGKKS